MLQSIQSHAASNADLSAWFTDETYVGGIEASKHEHKKLKAGRGTVGKTPVLRMRERGGRTFAKIIQFPTATRPRA
jgi:hypothetical protein